MVNEIMPQFATTSSIINTRLFEPRLCTGT